MLLKTLQTQRDIDDLLDLQAQNMPQALNQYSQRSQGFLTVQHNAALLRAMMAAAPQVILRDRAVLAGYALAMPVAMREAIPVLVPMFEQLEQLHFQDKPLQQIPYIVMGQICIASSYRGQGFFELLYDGLRLHLSDTYEIIITEVSTRNPRSLRAHHRMGFQTFHTYSDPSGEHWELIAWDWGEGGSE
jgi:hypothetical protein